MEQKANEVLITITESAAKKVKSLAEKEDKKDYGLRLGIVPGGCSSFMYEISLEKDSKQDDFVFEEKGVKIFINPQSIDFLRGSTVDYIDTLQNSGFKINNPNVKSSCGCGHSVG